MKKFNFIKTNFDASTIQNLNSVSKLFNLNSAIIFFSSYSAGWHSDKQVWHFIYITRYTILKLNHHWNKCGFLITKRNFANAAFQLVVFEQKYFTVNKFRIFLLNWHFIGQIIRWWWNFKWIIAFHFMEITESNVQIS